MDFLLNCERMVIETKMTRERLDQAKVVEELVIDKAHALPSAPRLQDARLLRLRPEQRLTNPDALEADLSDETTELVTRVVVAPRAD